MIETANNKLKDFLIKTFADPVLVYMALLVSSVMYHYRDSLALIYGLTAYVGGWIMFRLFDFMRKHKFIGGVVYIISAWIFLRGMGMCIEQGYSNYPISFPVWFITPQDSLQYNKWYTLAMFVFFFFFMASVVYFFTRVQYRVFMTFVIMIIPFAIYGKEYEEMPVQYIISLAVGYIILVMYFRQLTDNKDVIVIDKYESWKSGIVFTAIFAVIAAIIPKPSIEADRTVLETMINADAFTDRLVEMLNVFRDTTAGNQFRGRLSDTPLYYVHSPENLRLKTSTFSTYDYINDSWSTIEGDNSGYSMETQPFDIDINAEICDAVFYAASLEGDFAKNYVLAEYAGHEFSYPERQEVSVFSSYQNGTRFPIPQSTVELLESSYKGDIILSKTGNIISSSDGGEFKYNDFVRYSYIPDGFFDNFENKSVVDLLGSIENYSEMIHSAYEILEEYSEKDEKANHYLSVLHSSIDCNPYQSVLLDYGNNERIYSLALEITSGFDSDYDKAKEIEWYFINNGFIYDLNYRKEVGENAEDFIFDTKTGVCYEYATAMTLLARAAGIPARYCEGFNVHTKYENSRDDDMYVVTAEDAHGFPELYIKGYGWVSFEPTMVFDVANTQQDERQATGLLSRMGIIILGVCIIVLLIIILYPVLTHKFFMLINQRRSPDKAVLGVIHRLCGLYGIPVSSTSHEAAETIKRMTGSDISATAVLFDRAEYGGAELTENDRVKAMGDYVAAYEAFKQYKKDVRKQKHRKKKEV